MVHIRQWLKASFPRLVYRRALSRRSRSWSDRHVADLHNRNLASLSEASFDVFTYHGEDGILLYLLSKMENVPRFFVDIGAGDGITGNCTNLAVHYDWTGIFIDQQKDQAEVGKKFYEKVKRAKQPLFTIARITPGNINLFLEEYGVPREVGLLSIDIDGNDYWIWEAINVVNPRIVVIEAKVEFGLRDLVVPYGDNNHRSLDPYFNGASVEALRKLGLSLGYKLVGANKQGYNLFFVRVSESIPEANTQILLSDPAIKGSFYPESFFAKHTFAK